MILFSEVLKAAINPRSVFKTRLKAHWSPCLRHYRRRRKFAKNSSPARFLCLSNPRFSSPVSLKHCLVFLLLSIFRVKNESNWGLESPWQLANSYTWTTSSGGRMGVRTYGLANFLSYVAPLSHPRRAGAPLLSKIVENTWNGLKRWSIAPFCVVIF